MPSSLQDRIRVKTSTLGFSTVQLGNTVDGYENFSLLGTGIFNIYYFITTGLEWEHGKGVYNSENNTITRDTIVRSSNNGSHVSLFDTSIVYLSNENDDRFIYTSNGVPPESGYFVTGNGSRFITKEISSSDIENALGYSPYDSTNPKNYITLDSLPETLLYSIDTYYDPEWISHLNPDKVEKDSPLWNAAKIQGYRISDQQPFPDQFLGWNVYANQWEPTDVISGTGVAATYTASSGVIISSSNIYMGGTGTLDKLQFSSSILIGSGTGDNRENLNDQIYIGSVAGFNSSGNNQYGIGIGYGALYESISSLKGVAIGYFAGYASSGLVNSISIGNLASYQAAGSELIAIGYGSFGQSVDSSYSIAIGNAGASSSGNYNIYIGKKAGQSVKGSNNLEILNSGVSSSIIGSNSNKLNIQHTFIGDTSNKKIAIGNVGSGNLNPNATVEIIAKTSTDKVLISKGAVSQTANLIEAQSSSGTVLFSVDNSGYISTPSSGISTWNASKLQNYPITTGYIPTSGQFLYYDGSGWIPESISVVPSFTTNYVDFNPLNNPPAYHEGRVFYDKDSATLAYYNNESGVTLNIGQENYLYVKNINASGGIPNGAVVYIDGAVGKTPTANLAIASNDASSQIVGVATMAIPLDSYGYITTQGIVHDLNTQGYVAGTAIFLSPTSSGAFTHTEPLPPNYPIKVGTIINVHNSQGSILVDPVPHYVDGNQIVGDIYARNSGNIFTGNVLLNGAISGTLSTTNLTTIDSTPYSSGDCVKYIVKAKYGTAVQASEILVTSDGTESYMTEYGLIYTSGLLADISTSYSSSNIILSAQATHSNTSIHMFKILIS